MRPERSRRRDVLYSFAALGLLVGAACWVVVASSLSSRREEMTVKGEPVEVEYATSVSAGDVMLPFYPGAKLEHGFAYSVKTGEGKELAYYASALLTSADPPEKVAASYQAQLPGKPEPELVKDESGKRYVLAVGKEGEVREVAIASQGAGSRIQLIRATGPTIPPGFGRAPSPPRFRMPFVPRRGPAGRFPQRGSAA